MESLNSETDLHSLVDAVIDDTADDAALALLSRRLEQDPAFRSNFVACMAIEAELHAVHTVTPCEIAIHEPLASTPRTTEWRRGMPAWLAIAASLVVVAAGSAWVTYRSVLPTVGMVGEAETVELGDNQVGDSQHGVARITGTRDCRWGLQDRSTEFGDVLAAGRVLELEAGLAEISFDGGARIVLEGPCKFRVPGQERGELLAGRIAAAVPRDAVEFSIRTPRLAIDQAGTQYGLEADPDGGTEVHVFEGPLFARALDVKGRELGGVELAASEAARLTPVSATFALFRAEGSRFVRTLTPSAGPTQGLLAMEEFSYPVGPLAWQNGGFGWAGPWADIETADEADETGAAPTNAVAAGSLAGCELISRGNRAIQTGQRNRVRRALSTSLGGVFDAAGLVENQDGMRLIGQDNRTVYLSFLQRVSEVDDVFYGFEMHRGDGNPNRVLCIGNGAEGSGYGVTSNFNDYRGDNYRPLGVEDREAHLFVVRIDFGLENRDLVTVYRNPTSLIDERKCAATATLRGNFAFDRISLGNFDGVKGKVHEVDEIRVGTSFTAVTGQRNLERNALANRFALVRYKEAPWRGLQLNPRLLPLAVGVFR